VATGVIRCPRNGRFDNLFFPGRPQILNLYCFNFHAKRESGSPWPRAAPECSWPVARLS
jgi:hypothetical protein